MIHTELQAHFDACNVLPVLLIAEASCEFCGHSGYAVEIGWLFFTFTILFYRGGQHE